MENKRCSRCHQEKPVSEFYPRKKRPGQFQSQCKDCDKQTALARYAAKQAGIARPPKPTDKRCTRCGVVFPLEQFPWKNKAAGWRRATCRACTTALKAEYVREHPEQKIASEARYRERNKEILRERYRQWVKDHPERAAAIARASEEKHIDARKAAGAAYRKAHPEQRLVYSHARMARKAGNGGSFTVEEWQALKDFYDNRCLWCGASGVLLTPDHIVPIARGGSSNIENIQPLCKLCNSTKNNRVMDFRPEPE